MAGDGDENGGIGTWRFLVDENLRPEIASELEARGFRAEHVLDALYEGADDTVDVLPYCRETDAILLTNGFTDFNDATLAPEDHAGVIIVYDKGRPATEIADAVGRIVDAYGERDALRAFENADDWLR
jgi:predicted nuclease of predicted toxin-antitoxin system